MAFRDDSAAARARADALQREVDAARGELQRLRAEREDATELRARLEAAERDLAAMRRSPKQQATRQAIWVAIGIVVFLAVGMVFVSYRAATPATRVTVTTTAPAAPAARPKGIDALVLVGFSQQTIAILGALAPSQDEIDGLGEIKRAGASDETCLELLRAARAAKRPLIHGSAAAALLQAGVAQDTLAALARLQQLGWSSDVIAMRRAGVEDVAILLLAQRRSRLQLSIGGTEVARLRQAGFSDAAILALADKGLRPAHVAGLIAQIRAGVSAKKIVASYRAPRAAEAE